MKTPVFPLLCATALVLMAGAATSHWWSVRQFASAMESSPQPTAISAALPAPEPPRPASAAAPAPAAQSTAAAPDSKQQEFYTALLARMESLQNQNRDLLDQLAETNRDLMKLEFRVDTHSESFRPLPVTEEISSASFTDDLGVLPPRDDMDLPPLHD